MATGLFAPSCHFKNHHLLSAPPVLGIARFNYSCNYVSGRDSSKFNLNRFRVRAIKQKSKETNSSASSSSAEEVTKKYGLEAGLFQILRDKAKNKSKGEQVKELFAKYGGAYLATSITLSLISFSLCYALISYGVDVPALLQKVGIASNETGEKVGTFALAYAAHKAASPIRFPPTVVLTPIVANWPIVAKLIGKKDEKEI